MGFVNDRLPDKDYEKWRRGRWAIDREKNIFLFKRGPGCDRTSEFELYKNDELLIKVYSSESYMEKQGSSQDEIGDFILFRDLSSIAIPAKYQNQKEEILSLLKEAIEVYEGGDPKGKYPNIEVVVTILGK